MGYQIFCSRIAVGSLNFLLAKLVRSGLLAILLVLHFLVLPAKAGNAGTPFAWGYNYFGLGDGTTTNRSTPVQVKYFSPVTAIAPGDIHSLALASQGNIFAWGYNYYGQLGDGTTTSSSIPV